MDDTFTLLPITLNETTKAVDLTNTATTSSILDLSTSLTTLNTLHRNLLTTAHACPPPPIPIHPQRSSQITKLRESGNAAFRKSQYLDATKMYTYALEMALARPPWEPSQLVRDESAPIYANRSQAHVAMRNWPEALADAEASVFCKPKDNVKAWYRRALCLKEMGMLEESRDVLEMAVDWAAEGPDMQPQQPGQPPQLAPTAGAGKTDAELKSLLRDVVMEIGARDRSGL